LKNIFTILLVVFCLQAIGQTDSQRVKRDTAHVARYRVAKDSAPAGIYADTTNPPADTRASNIKRDSAVVHDSVTVAPVIKKTLPWDKDTAFTRLITIQGDSKAQILLHSGDVRAYTGNDELFYILTGILLFMGVIKIAYPKYFQNTFRLIFQTSLRQKQTPEQIVQGYVPGFLLNMLFFMVVGVLIALFASQYQQQHFLQGPFWLLVLFCTAILAVVYLVKYTVTFLAGWVFNVKEAAGMYSFVVFLVNRVLGIILLPLVIILAYYGGQVQSIMFTIAVSIIVLLLLYRYTLSLTVMRKNLKVSALHFFIYLCAVELMPLLVIYKVLLREIIRQ